MMHPVTRALTWAASLLILFPALAQTPLTTDWTYQGEVVMSGVPLNGLADFEFTLWDHKTTGNMIGSLAARTNVAVTEGRFTVQLDFGAGAFNGDRRWLEIAVRSPSGAGAFTTLSPRQSLTIAPHAAHALNGTPWTVDGTTLHYDNGFVGIARDTPQTSGEVFGIHKHVSPGGFGGMYASTNSGGKPFYGYRAGGEWGWHHVDTTTGDWHLVLDGVRMTVRDEGGVGIGTELPEYPLHIVTSDVRGIFVQSSGSGSSGVSSHHSADNGFGLYGIATAANGIAAGVGGATHSAAGGRGVSGIAFSSSGLNYGVYGASNSSQGYDFYAGGNGQNYGSSSSIRWKNNIEPIDHPLAKLARLRGVYFDWDADHGGHHDVGMIAEEVGAVLPEIVNYEENGVDAIGMDYSKLTPLLVEAVNSLRSETNRELADQAKIIKDLTIRNSRLEDRLAQLESAVAQLTPRDDDED